MSERTDELSPACEAGPNFPPERLLEMIRGVLDDTQDLEPMPRKPAGLMTARELAENPESDTALATMRWQLHATDVLFRNRRQLQGVLWACRVLRDTFGDTPEFEKHGTPLALKLIGLGWRQDVPGTHAGIADAVRTWQPSSARSFGRAA